MIGHHGMMGQSNLLSIGINKLKGLSHFNGIGSLQWEAN